MDNTDLRKRADEQVKFTDHARIEMVKDNIYVDEILHKYR